MTKEDIPWWLILFPAVYLMTTLVVILALSTLAGAWPPSAPQ
jgi:hypothetical protein